MPASRADLLIRPTGEPVHLTSESAGFDYLSFRVCRLERGDTFSGDTGANELAIVMLGGLSTVECPEASWRDIGGRATVFDGMPYAVYLPIDTRFRVAAASDCEFALCFAKAEERHPARLIRPQDVEIEIRGGGNATRQINHIIKPEFPAQRLLIVEVYTPSGNWSSYPPHKHDVHDPPKEVDLEEIYFFKVNRPEGYAVQKLYTADRRVDETLTVHDGELVLVREGYHPVVAAHGYDVYYLNALAGSARSMAASDDPEYAWVRSTWKEKDPRLPVVKR